MLNKLKNRLKKEVLQNKTIYFILLLILVFSALFRLYRLDALLGFYYDQGRDALKVQEILSLQNLPAIGPTTGIAGLFLGPFWFYLLTPFYLIGQGSPVVAASFICFFDVATVFLLFWLGKEFFNRQIGLMAAFFWGFSHYLIRSARWFSNPSPLPFFVVLLLYGLGKFFLKKEEKYLLLISFCLAVSLQLEMASAVFFFPVIGLLWLVFKNKLQKRNYYLGSILIFIGFLIPQFLFEIKNNFLMTKNFFSFTKGDLNTDTQTWTIPSVQLIKERIVFYFDSLFSKLETNPGLGAKILAPLWFLYVLYQFRKEKIKSMTFILIIWLFLPLFLLFFFVGNYGRLYDYYLTGFFPAFIFLFALFVFSFWQRKFLLPIFIIILFWFFNGNFFNLRNYLSAGVDGPTHVSLGNQLQAIDWFYQDAGEDEFNLDIYVPPVIPYSYDYLVDWRAKRVYQRQPVEEPVSLLYTLYEVDPPHPERLGAWLERQAGIGEITEKQQFGGVTVERRKRLK